ncbi:MAG: hypothetical protein WC928_02120 [Patescibacteria group bacterium]|jgi:cob(I)alamin adenosyltransferase
MKKNNYKIKDFFYSLRDKKTTNFHIEKNDYFGTLATIIGLINQAEILQDEKELKKILSNLKKDLLYLQKNFVINKKT